MTASGTQALLDAVGCDLTTTLVTADGDVLGVGHAKRHAPGWLAGLVDLVHDRCVIPGCRTTVTDRDHAVAWDDGGTTDLDNLAPLCRAHHVEKDDGRVWQIDHEDGNRIRVTHRATGWTQVTRPRLDRPPAPSRADTAIAGTMRQPRRVRPRPPNPRPTGPPTEPTAPPGSSPRSTASPPDDVPF